MHTHTTSRNRLQHITQELEPGTIGAVAAAVETLNVPAEEAEALARELIREAVAAHQSIDDQLIPWILARPKFKEGELSEC